MRLPLIHPEKALVYAKHVGGRQPLIALFPHYIKGILFLLQGLHLAPMIMLAIVALPLCL